MGYEVIIGWKEGSFFYMESDNPIKLKAKRECYYM